MEQMNLFDIEIITYPKIKDVKMSKVQAMFIINALKLYEINLRKIDRKDLVESSLYQFGKKRELREIKELVEYFENKIGGGNRKNKRVCENVEEAHAMFDWLKE